MTITLPEQQKFELTPEGTHLAVCYRVVDLGTQDINWQGTIKKQHKIMISWELPEEKMADGRPFSMHKQYTLSSSDKATLRADLQAWRGKPFTDNDFGNFDIGLLICVPCLLGVVHNVANGKTYANISSISRLMKGQTAPKLTNETLYFSLDDFKQDVFDKLSEGMRLKISKSPEYAKAKGIQEDPNVSDDAHESTEGIPF